MLTMAEVMDALGEDNRYYASIALGRSPTDFEAIAHYLANRPIPPHIYGFTVESSHEFLVNECRAQSMLFDPPFILNT